MTRILIVEDHPSTASGLAALIEREPDLEVVGVSDDVEDALRKVADLAPSIVVCDIQLHGRPAGFDILRSIAEASGPAVILFSSFDYPAFRQRAVELGAVGYLPKTASAAEIVAAIRSVAGGGTTFSAAALREAARGVRRPSDREAQVLQLIRSGLSNDEIGARLGIGTRGVESSIRRLFQRCDVFSRTELITFAEAQGWLAMADEGQRQPEG